MTATGTPGILLLGGIGEARKLAAELTEQEINVIYSIAGLVRMPNLDCVVRCGGFSSDTESGVDGLTTYIRQNNITLLVNATHPYAATVGHNAVNAARHCGIPCWRYYRPGWREETKGEYRSFTDIPQLLPLLSAVKRPLFTIGKRILAYHDSKPDSQHWIVRTAVNCAPAPGLTILHNIGPFSFAEDLTLMQAYRIDALITKDSGGEEVTGKLRAAHRLGIPVFIQRRPEQATADRQFSTINALRDAVVAYSSH